MSQSTLQQTTAIAALADVLYEFLPGSGNALWKGHVNIRSVAARVGLGDFCQPGSKLPMITTLLELTIQHRPRLFERFILELTREGIVYRRKQKRPLAIQEIDSVSGLVAQLGFHVSELSDPTFRAGISADPIEAAKLRAQELSILQAAERHDAEKRRAYLSQLEARFFALHSISDRQTAGYSLESILNEVFALSKLAPRPPFRVVGEQIDGSFQLDHEGYLLEAKWEKEPLNEQALLVFRGKIEGKSAFTRGVFISIHGYTSQAKDAFTRGKQPNFFSIDGYDLAMILCGKIELVEFLRRRQRLLTDEGAVFLPFNELHRLDSAM